MKESSETHLINKSLSLMETLCTIKVRSFVPGISITVRIKNHLSRDLSIVYICESCGLTLRGISSIFLRLHY